MLVFPCVRRFLPLHLCSPPDFLLGSPSRALSLTLPPISIPVFSRSLPLSHLPISSRLLPFSSHSRPPTNFSPNPHLPTPLAHFLALRDRTLSRFSLHLRTLTPTRLSTPPNPCQHHTQKKESGKRIRRLVNFLRPPRSQSSSRRSRNFQLLENYSVSASLPSQPLFGDDPRPHFKSVADAAVPHPAVNRPPT